MGYDYAVAQKLGWIPKLSTAAMMQGKLIHAMISEALGGEEAKIAISPYDAFRTKEAKEWRDSQPDDTAIVKESEYEDLKTVVDRVLNHPRLVEYLSQTAMTEKTTEKQVNGFNV